MASGASQTVDQQLEALYAEHRELRRLNPIKEHGKDLNFESGLAYFAAKDKLELQIVTLLLQQQGKLSGVETVSRGTGMFAFQLMPSDRRFAYLFPDTVTEMIQARLDRSLIEDGSSSSDDDESDDDDDCW